MAGAALHLRLTQRAREAGAAVLPTLRAQGFEDRVQALVTDNAATLKQRRLDRLTPHAGFRFVKMDVADRAGVAKLFADDGEIKLGPVEAVIAPNAMHHMYLPAFTESFPTALVYVADGVTAKHPDLQVSGLLGEEPEPLWAFELDQHRIAGQPRINEVAFLHKPSRTLLLADWLFNFNRSDTWWTRTFLRLAGAYHGPSQSRLLRLSIADRAAARASRDRLLAWDFDRIIVAHGDIIPRDGKAVVRKATAWLGP